MAKRKPTTIDYRLRHDYYIYCHTTPSNKKYVGYSSGKYTCTRWGKNGSRYSKNPAFWNAICKYGWDNIKHEVLERGLSFEEANNREIYYISLYKSNDKRFGYNLTEGGSNPNCTPETRAKISKAKTGVRYFKKGHIIYQYDLSGNLIGTYRSYHEASDMTGFPLYHIASCCNKNSLYRGIFAFSKMPLTIDEIHQRYIKANNYTPIYVYDIIEDCILPRFDNSTICSHTLHVQKDTIVTSASDNPNKDFAKEFPRGYYFRKIPINDDIIKYAKTKFYSKNHHDWDLIKWKKERLNAKNSNKNIKP